MKNQLLLCAVMLISVVMLAGCAAGPNPVVHTTGTDGNIAGFLLGLWHGLICPVTFIFSLFSDSVHFYEVHNNGGWYNLGFLMGAATISLSKERSWTANVSKKRCRTVNVSS